MAAPQPSSHAGADTPELVFIIGAARSGTTWLHLMMGSHPQIATGQESQVFEGYLAPMARRWQDELDWPETESVRKHGISAYLTDEEFTEMLGDMALRVLTRVRRDKPEATHVLEKSPNNAHHAGLVHRCLPDVHFIHVVRDGRDVANSMMRASEGWGRSWAPGRVEDAAKDWAAAVRAGRKARHLTDRYTEVRYEELLSNGADELCRLFDFVGISVPADECSRIYDAFRFDRLKRGEYERSVFLNPGTSAASGTEGRNEPPDFFRKGVAGDWRNHFSTSDEKVFDWVAGELLAELGYAAPDAAVQTKAPLALRARAAKRALRTWFGRAGRRVLGN